MMITTVNTFRRFRKRNQRTKCSRSNRRWGERSSCCSDLPCGAIQFSFR